MNRMAFVTGLLAVTAFLCLSQTTFAQLAVQTEDATSVVIDTSDYKDFHFVVTNNTFGSQTFYVRRVEQNIPDENWASTICMEDFCYSFRDDSTGLESVPVGGAYDVKLTVYTGYEMDESATLTFEFIWVSLSGVVKFGEVTLNVETGEISSTPIDVDLAALPYPNPVNESISIPLLHGETTGSLRIFDATGRMTEEHDLSGRTAGTFSLSVGTLPVGAYTFTIATADASRHGRFVVAR